MLGDVNKHPAGRIGFGQVNCQAGGRDAERSRQLAQPIAAAGDQDQLGSGLPREPPRGRLTDAAGGTGDQRGPSPVAPEIEDDLAGGATAVEQACRAAAAPSTDSGSVAPTIGRTSPLSIRRPISAPISRLRSGLPITKAPHPAPITSTLLRQQPVDLDLGD